MRDHLSLDHCIEYLRGCGQRPIGRESEYRRGDEVALLVLLLPDNHGRYDLPRVGRHRQYFGGSTGPTNATTTVTTLAIPHLVTGSAQFNASTSVTVALGAAAYANGYNCTVTSQTNTARTFQVDTSSLTSLVITADLSSTDIVQYICAGN